MVIRNLVKTLNNIPYIELYSVTNTFSMHFQNYIANTKNKNIYTVNSVYFINNIQDYKFKDDYKCLCESYNKIKFNNRIITHLITIGFIQEIKKEIFIYKINLLN